MLVELRLGDLLRLQAGRVLDRLGEQAGQVPEQCAVALVRLVAVLALVPGAAVVLALLATRTALVLLAVVLLAVLAGLAAGAAATATTTGAAGAAVAVVPLIGRVLGTARPGASWTSSGVDAAAFSGVPEVVVPAVGACPASLVARVRSRRGAACSVSPPCAGAVGWADPASTRAWRISASCASTAARSLTRLDKVACVV